MKSKQLTLSLFLIFITMFCTVITQNIVLQNKANNSPLEYPQQLIKMSDGETHSMIIPTAADVMVNDEYPTISFHWYPLRVGRVYTSLWRTERGWMMFNLSHIPNDIVFTDARVHLYLDSGYVQDLPIGVYHCRNDTWTEKSITWNSQPIYDALPLDTINSPTSPDMFVSDTWYSWDVSSVIQSTLNGNQLLSLVIRQIDETPQTSTLKTFEQNETEPLYRPYITLDYITPTTGGLNIDGHSSGPEIDYLQNPTPTLGWEFQDTGDSQQRYEIEIAEQGGEVIWDKNETKIADFNIDEESLNTYPFIYNKSVRFQMEWQIILPSSGMVDKISFATTATNGATITLHNFTLLMKVGNWFPSSLSTNFEANYLGVKPNTVLHRENLVLTVQDGYISIDVEDLVLIDNWSSLFIEMRYSNQEGSPIFIWNEDNAAKGSIAYIYGEPNTDTYLSPTAAAVYNRALKLRLEISSAPVIDATSQIGTQPPFGYDSMRIQMKFNQSMINREGLIDRLYFKGSLPLSYGASLILENFTVRLLEIPKDQELYTTFDANYHGLAPITVLDKSTYTLHNLGIWLIIDVEDNFYYNNQGDLLIEMTFDEKTGVNIGLVAPNIGAISRVYSTNPSSTTGSTSTDLYVLALDIKRTETEVDYDGPTLVNNTAYIFRVRTCDNLGIWSSWQILEFTLNVFTMGPIYTAFEELIDPHEYGSSFSVHLNISHPFGVTSTLIEIGGLNHSMLKDAGRYSYSWTPDMGIHDYRILMEDGLGHWRVIEDSVTVLDTTPPQIVGSEDIEYIVGETGNRITWTMTELRPSQYFILIDGGLERSGIWEGSPIGFYVDGLPIGVHNVTLKVTDLSDNEAFDTVVVTVSEEPITTTTTSIETTTVESTTPTSMVSTTPTSTITTTEETTTSTEPVTPTDNGIVMFVAGIALGGVGTLVLIIIILRIRRGRD